MSICKWKICFQTNYVLDSFTQYVGRLPTTRTRDRSVRAHYVAFRKMGDTWYRFDDGVVHRINLMRAYSVNLVIYRMAQVPAYDLPMSLAAVPELGKSVILNCKPSETPQNAPTPSVQNPIRPSLITPTERRSSDVGNSMPSNAMRPERPTRIQLSWRNKDFVVYFGLDSQSSGDEAPPDRTHPDSDYVPDTNRGLKSDVYTSRIFNLH